MFNDPMGDLAGPTNISRGSNVGGDYNSAPISLSNFGQGDPFWNNDGFLDDHSDIAQSGDPYALQAYALSHGGTNLYTAANPITNTAGSGSLTVALAAIYSNITPATGMDTYVNNSGQVVTVPRLGSTARSTVSVQGANNTWDFVDASVGAANQGGQTVGMGQYGTLNILQYSAYYDGKSMGVTINLGLNNTTGYENLRWVQTISTNYALRTDLKSPYFDRYPNSSLPFYPMFPNQHGFDFEFYDQPIRPAFDLNGGDDIYWRASLTLVGVTGNSYFPLFTINYGFTIQSGIYNQIPMSFSTPLPVTQTFSPSFPKNGP